MITEARLEMIAPCGIDCGICELYLCKDDPQLFKVLVEKGIPEDKIPCMGCRAIKGNCPVVEDLCATYTCVAEKQIEFCYDCNEFPCVRLHPSADRANVLPHNLKVFNLCTMQRQGLETFVAKSPGIKKRYYIGKMAIGKGPQLTE